MMAITKVIPALQRKILHTIHQLWTTVLSKSRELHGLKLTILHTLAKYITPWPPHTLTLVGTVGHSSSILLQLKN